MKIFNTLTRKKEEFIPIDKKEVRLYSCGPTVYYFAHIGNLRAYLFMDNLRRVLKYNGYNLKHVMNITDVGHLVSDADEGEDKMVKAAERENKNPFDIAEFYTKEFLNDIKKLNIDKPEIIAKATEHIKIMEKYVKKIIENGYAYETENTIYFDTSKLDKYGVLSNINIEELQNYCLRYVPQEAMPQIILKKTYDKDYQYSLLSRGIHLLQAII